MVLATTHDDDNQTMPAIMRGAGNMHGTNNNTRCQQPYAMPAITDDSSNHDSRAVSARTRGANHA